MNVFLPECLQVCARHQCRGLYGGDILDTPRPAYPSSPRRGKDPAAITGLSMLTGRIAKVHPQISAAPCENPPRSHRGHGALMGPCCPPRVSCLAWGHGHHRPGPTLSLRVASTAGIFGPLRKPWPWEHSLTLSPSPVVGRGTDWLALENPSLLPCGPQFPFWEV